MKRFILTVAILFAVLKLSAQQKANLLATYQGGDIVFTYQVPSFERLDSVWLKVYKMGAKNAEQLLVQQKVPTAKQWMFADTSTRKHPDVYQYRFQASVDTGILQNEVLSAYAFPPDLVPVASNILAFNPKSTNQIKLSWKIGSQFILRSIGIERSRKKDEGFSRLATVDGQDSVYLDIVDDANEPFFYRLRMEHIATGRSYYSAIIHVIPDFEIVPMSATNIKVFQEGKHIKLNWENVDKNANGFYVMKKEAAQDSFVMASLKIDINKDDKYTWVDNATSAVNYQVYQYFIVSESNSFHKSKPSDTVIISYQKLPAALSPPQNLQILRSDSISRIVWEIDSLRIDEIAAYAVYQKSAKATSYTLIPNGVVTANLNFLEIAKPRDGDSFYVTAVNGDKQSVPSIKISYRDAFQNEFGPKYLIGAVIDGVLNIKWLNNGEKKFNAYKLYKWNGKSFVLMEQIAADKDRIATKSYIAGSLNLYKLTTVNANGEESKGSNVLQVN